MSKESGALRVFIILETAVKGDKVMQDFDLESLEMGADHSQKVKAAPITSDYGSKDCVDLSPSTAVSRIIWIGNVQSPPDSWPPESLNS
jgi:hypothetical protein